MRTSFHHQPEAQRPNFQLPTSWQADYPIYWRHNGHKWTWHIGQLDRADFRFAVSSGSVALYSFSMLAQMRSKRAK